MKNLKKTYNSPYIKVEEILTDGPMLDGTSPNTPASGEESGAKANFDFDETEWDDTDDKNTQK